MSNSENEVEDLVMTPSGEMIDAKSVCSFCGLAVDKYSPDSWKQTKGWVGGPRKDSMRLREDTGYYAHSECVLKVAQGQAVDQDSLFDEPSSPQISSWSPGPEELFNDNR